MAGKADQADIEAFIADYGVDAFTHTIDDTGSLWGSFDVASQPAFVFINDDGTVTTHQGAMGADALNAELDALLSS